MDKSTVVKDATYNIIRLFHPCVINHVLSDLSRGVIDYNDIEAYCTMVDPQGVYIDDLAVYNAVFRPSGFRKLLNIMLAMLDTPEQTLRHIKAEDLNCIITNNLQEKFIGYLKPTLSAYQIKMIIHHLTEGREDLIPYYTSNKIAIEHDKEYCLIALLFKYMVDMSKYDIIFNTPFVENLISSFSKDCDDKNAIEILDAAKVLAENTTIKEED